ncbi:hypothetical protein VP91_00010140 [Candidatus Pelagibacter ubique]|uniref:Uncharacterized protein n=1 Tax=Pelagibacter ubique TaxID=198252 RepID=A0ABX1T3N0_PELUQ|nr:hypothetical protein [Candidatus Pelagibacter ubique]
MIFFVSIFVTQFMCEKKIFYTRFFNFLILNLFLFFSVYLIFDLNYKFINFLFCLSLIFSWSGLIIHLSNSIVLSLLNLVNKNDIIHDENIFDLYNQDDKYKKRVLALINGEYLFERNNQINFNTNFKNKMILHLILFLKK